MCLDEHVRHCVRNAAAESTERADAMIEEATQAIERLVRT
jgi:DNA-binding FrmR family transcriptional regulator